jgi:protein gp37
MAENSKIEWTDTTWNPVVGCTRVSAGCDNCYAVTMTKRLEAMGQEKYTGLVNHGKNHFNGAVRTVEDALPIPLSWRKPRKVFVNSMSDLFHEKVPFEFVDRAFAIMALTPQHTYQVLTKRPDRMAEYFNRHNGGIRFPESLAAELDKIFPSVLVDDLGPGGDSIVKREIPGWWDRLNKVEGFGAAAPPNVWIGTSVEDQKTADERIPELLEIPARVRFLSCEPLLGPVDLRCYTWQVKCLGCNAWRGAYSETDAARGEIVCPECGSYDLFESEWYPDDPKPIDWVIAGGESGHNARPMHPDWARSLRDQCQAAGVPFLFKQWGEWAPCENNDELLSYGSGLVRTAEGSDWPKWRKIGKHKAGRLLDGRTWDEYPEAANG